MGQLELELGDTKRLVRGPDGMHFVLMPGDTLEAFRRDFPGSRLEVVDWPSPTIWRASHSAKIVK